MKKIKRSTVDKIKEQILNSGLSDLEDLGTVSVYVSVARRSIHLTGTDQPMPDDWFCIGVLEHPDIPSAHPSYERDEDGYYDFPDSVYFEHDEKRENLIEEFMNVLKEDYEIYQ